MIGAVRARLALASEIADCLVGGKHGERSEQDRGRTADQPDPQPRDQCGSGYDGQRRDQQQRGEGPDKYRQRSFVPGRQPGSGQLGKIAQLGKKGDAERGQRDPPGRPVPVLLRSAAGSAAVRLVTVSSADRQSSTAPPAKSRATPTATHSRGSSESSDPAATAIAVCRAKAAPTPVKTGHGRNRLASTSVANMVLSGNSTGATNTNAVRATEKIIRWWAPARRWRSAGAPLRSRRAAPPSRAGRGRQRRGRHRRIRRSR